MSNFILLSRFGAFVIFSHSLYCQHVIPNPIHKLPLGSLLYLTYWNLVLHLIFFTGVLFIKHWLKSKNFDKCISAVLYSLLIPVGSFVILSFWYLKLFQPDMLFKSGSFSMYPLWFQHTTHTLPFAFSMIELWFTTLKIPSRKSSLSVLTVFMAAYAMTVFSNGLVYNVWPYPVFAVLSWLQRIVFILVCHSMCIAFYFLGIALSRARCCKTKRSIV